MLNHPRALQRVCLDAISLLLSQSLNLNQRTHVPSSYLRIRTEIHPLCQPWSSAEPLTAGKPRFPRGCGGKVLPKKDVPVTVPPSPQYLAHSAPHEVSFPRVGVQVAPWYLQTNTPKAQTGG